MIGDTVGAAVEATDCADLHGVLSSWNSTEKRLRILGIETPRKGWSISDRDLVAIEDVLNGEGHPPERATLRQPDSIQLHTFQVAR